MFNFLNSWLLIMAQHVLFTAAEQNIIPRDRYGNITHETDSSSDWLMHWHRHDDARCSTHKTKATDEGQNVLHADDSDRWRWKRSTCRRQPQTKLQTLTMIQTLEDTHTMSLQKTTVLYYLNGPQRNCRELKWSVTLTLTLDRVKVTSTYTVHVGLPAGPTTWL